MKKENLTIKRIFTMKTNYLKQLSIITILILAVLTVTSCGESANGESKSEKEQKPQVMDNGLTIKFPESSAGLKQITTTPVKKSNSNVSVIAPARVVSSISTGTNDKIFLFESGDITTLFSSYRQNKQNVQRTTGNLARIKDMFENHAVTGKDLNDAETDAANARSAFSEMEGKLRSAGYNPMEIETSAPGTVWIISDVPESQLKEVQHGEQVHIRFDSYPDRHIHGNVSAIGDVVDPVTRSIKVRVVLHNPPVKLLPGMFCNVDFGNPVDGIIELPLTSVVSVDGKDYSFVETSPGEFVRKQIVSAFSGQDKIIVLSGINSGEKVVTSGSILLKGLSFGF